MILQGKSDEYDVFVVLRKVRAILLLIINM